MILTPAATATTTTNAPAVLVEGHYCGLRDFLYLDVVAGHRWWWWWWWWWRWWWWSTRKENKAKQ